MSWKCQDCGNRDRFNAPATDHITVRIDGEGDFVQTLDDDGCLEISSDGITCAKCESEDVVWVEPKQSTLDDDKLPAEAQAYEQGMQQ